MRKCGWMFINIFHPTRMWGMYDSTPGHRASDKRTVATNYSNFSRSGPGPGSSMKSKVMGQNLNAYITAVAFSNKLVVYSKSIINTE